MEQIEQPTLWLASNPDPAPVDCDHLWRKLPDLRAWFTRAARSQLDRGEHWRRADPGQLAEQIATHITAEILPVLDHYAVSMAHQEYHRLGLIPTTTTEETG